jgi:serine/threonine-protein kinase
LGENSQREPDLSGVPNPGDTVAGKYLIEERLGVGGMGAVMRAKRLTDGLAVALKVMLAEEAQHSDSTRRFFREAKAAGSLSSPHVTKLLDLGRLADGMPFMVLELLHGEALDAIIRDEAPLPIEQAVDYLLQACEGVAEAHARGIIHRDLKPSNLFRTRGPDGEPVVKVLDFGISKATMRLDPSTDHQSLTETNTTLGSPQYMSPEQLRDSKNVDSRTDVWALGLILHKLLTGLPAFEAKTVGEHFAMIFADPPTPLRARRPDAPASVERAILMCLQRELHERFQDVGQLAMALAPHHPAGAARAARVVDILESAGVSSSSHPSMEPVSASRREAPTVRVSAAPPKEFPDATTSQWSASTHSFPPRPNPRTRAAGAVLAAGALMAVASVYALTRTPATSERLEPALARALTELALSVSAELPPEAPPSDGPDDALPEGFGMEAQRKRYWQRFEDGVATKTELRALIAMCSALGDTECRSKAYAAWRDMGSGDEPTARPKVSLKTPRPTPKAPPPPPPPAEPAKTQIKPKGPMEDTL